MRFWGAAGAGEGEGVKKVKLPDRKEMERGEGGRRLISEAICCSAGWAGERRLADTGRRLQSSIHPEKKKKTTGPAERSDGSWWKIRI